MDWTGIDLRRLSTEQLLALQAIASAALAAPPEPKEELLLDVVCPQGSGAGDTIEVCVPEEAGGGNMRVLIPHGIRPGEAFEVKLG